ncbi:MAG: hypothetical protein U9Q27_03340, partial [Patescibacteria group bacterium]|nr:hypothetical protein [Patescibacteria group bacterium]
KLKIYKKRFSPFFKKMTQKSRKILIYFLIFLFLIISPILILYSQGYCFDFENKKITQTGTLFFKTIPKYTEIYLNKNLKNKTDFLFGSTLIENLAPKQYEIAVKKNNFVSWEKTLEVKAMQVNNAKNIILFPENPKFKNLNKNQINEIENFWAVPNQEKIILQEKEINQWVLKLFDTKKIVKTRLITEKEILKILKISDKNKLELLNLSFSSNPEIILLETEIKDARQYFALNIKKTPIDIVALDFLDPATKEISIYSFPQKFNVISDYKDLLKILFLKNNELYITGLSEKKENIAPVAKNILTYCVAQNNTIYYLNKNGEFYKTDFSFKTKEKLLKNAFDLDLEKKYKLENKKNFIFLTRDKSLYLFNSGTKSFKRLSNSVKNFIVSPDLKKICYINEYEIWILFLKDQYEQPIRKSGDEIFLTRFSKKIQNIFWLNSYYLMFNIQKNNNEYETKIMEIDNRDKINTYALFSNQISENQNNAKMFWNENNNKAYILSDKNLFESEKLIK